MSEILGRDPRFHWAHRPIHRVRCACGRIYVTAAYPKQIRETKYCNACRPFRQGKQGRFVSPQPEGQHGQQKTG